MDAVVGAERAKTRTFFHWIDGKPVGSADAATFEAVNPSTGQHWAHFSAGRSDDVEHAVAAASRAFQNEWRKITPGRRGRLLIAWAELIRQRADDIGRLETTQNGKLLVDTQAQARAIPDWLYYYGGLADKLEGSVMPLEKASILAYTLPEPLGVIGIITPWNSPSQLTMMAAAPALASGNTVVVKPSEVASSSVLLLAELAKEAGLPDGVFNVVTGLRPASEALVEHPHVAKVAFTGSVEGGRAIAKKAAERLIDCTLELGGKSPTIVFPDADLNQAEAGILGGIFAATGQTCVAGSRAYIHRSIYDQMLDRLVRRASNIVVGAPTNPRSQMGPVATSAQLEKDIRMVTAAASEGAQILYGGKCIDVPDSPGGFFFSPTILSVPAGANSILRDEVFGPVLAAVPFDDEDQVVAMANDSNFGLAAGVWTLDIRRAHRIARAIESGTVWVNMYRALACNVPFGGYKQSGIGVQNGLAAIKQYVKTKAVWCELSDQFTDAFAPRTQ